MPELPEVETVKRILEPQLAGRMISTISLNRPDVIEHPSAEIFRAAVTGKKIAGMGRRGKYLSIFLESGSQIILHLRMTGSLLVTPADYPHEKHTHVCFYLDNGNELRFIDPRRFGRFWLLQGGEEDIVSGIHKLGLEPINGKLTASYLCAALAKRKKSIKSCLLEQGVIAGIGNIYADEILFAAKIHPNHPANTLTLEEWEHLADTIPCIINRAITENKLSPEEYLAGKGQEYRNTPLMQVYGHCGEPCPVCGVALCRTIIAGRGSIYCPKCQGIVSC